MGHEPFTESDKKKKDLVFNASRLTYKMMLNGDYSQLMGIWNIQK